MSAGQAQETELIGDFTPSRGTFRGVHFLAIMLTFFGVIIAVNFYMLTSALGSFGGLVTPNSYVASQLFEEDQAAQRASAIAGWTIELDHDAATEDGAALVVSIEEDGTPVSGLGLAADLGRPSHAREDLTLAFREIAPGRYVSTEAAPLGVWRVTLIHVVAESGAVERRSARIHIRAPRGAS